jgi:hypothetical protein
MRIWNLIKTVNDVLAFLRSSDRALLTFNLGDHAWA